MQSGLHCRGEDTVRCMAIRQEAVVSHDNAYFVPVRRTLQGDDGEEQTGIPRSTKLGWTYIDLM